MNSITLDCKTKEVGDIIAWCYEHFGGDHFTFKSQFPSYRWVFNFHNSKELTLFQLRWQ
jgi:hypothetical protein